MSGMSGNGRKCHPGTGLPAKQAKAVAALVTEGTVGEAARKAQVSERTLHRWMNEEEFSTALRTARRRVMGGLTRALLGLAEKAVKAYEDALKPGQPIQVRKAAADSVIRRLSDLHEQDSSDELEERVRVLEERAEEAGYGKSRR